VVFLLSVHLSLAVPSLVAENPTIDEVIHLPAGITYWRTGSFRMYHHNPPLVKLVAALPVVASGGYGLTLRPAWWDEPTNKALFAHTFQQENAPGYFELFSRGRLLMPLFSVLGGLVVFAWSRRLYGTGAGLLSLALWVVCPNVLAHGRLVTTDMGATALGVLATYVFWLYLRQPGWRRALLAGVCLGLAELSKFSLLLLYGLWPLFALVDLVFRYPFCGLAARLGRALLHGGLMLVVSVLLIDAGYGFEGVGIPLGRYEFISRTLTRDVERGVWQEKGPDPLRATALQHRLNRFRGTWLGALPAPLPKHYLLGFDDQKFEAEGVPQRFLDPNAPADEVQGYPVYLDGELRQKSWWYYYLLTLVYKVPEGTWVLVLASLAVLVLSARSRGSWFDEALVLTIPAVVVFVMSVFTNINLGLRYVLPIFPYVFISAGKLVPWAAGLSRPRARAFAWTLIGGGLLATTAGTLAVAPHFLAYFNAVSGGPSRGSTHLIDSNLDWGQDLVGLRRWVEAHAPGERVGIAYFGQINPNIFLLRDEGPMSWFLPPPRPGTMPGNDLPQRYGGGLEGIRFEPGLYAVSASLLRGLPWRVYADEFPRWAPRSAWFDAFSYFQELTPVDQVGHSILIYRVTPEQAERLSRHWKAGAKGRGD
jgi:4-amino-4-deoxy-L-arabinose transferase-like glycosyltransferase